MANVTIPAVGTGSTTPIVSTDNVTADSSQVQNIQWVTVSGGVLARVTPLQNGGNVVVTSSALPTGAATQTTLATLLTDTQLRATPVPVSGTVTTSPPSNASTNIAQIAGNTPQTGHGVATGALRVELPTDGTGIVGLAAGSNAIGTVTANLGTIAGVATAAKQPALGTVGVPSADFITVQGNASGTPIPVAGTFSASGTTDLTASGNLTASGQTVAITTLNGMSACQIDVSGTYTHSLLSEATVDGTNWFGITTPFVSAQSGGSAGRTTNQILANGRYQVPVAGFSGVRVNCTLTGTGTAVIALRASAAAGVNQNLATVGNVAVDTNSGTMSSGTQRVTIATDSTGQVKLAAGVAAIGSLTAGSAIVGKVGIDQTTPGTTNLVALAANQTVNQAQVAGTAVDTNSGNKSAGTQRIVIATDQPNLTTALNVALAANQSVNNAQVSGTAVSVNNGTVDAGTQRVTLASNSTGTVALAAGAAAIGSVTTELTTGLTTFSNTALSSTKTAVKAGAGKVYGWMIHNPSAATTFLQVWNVAIGSITVGTTAPTYTIPIPAGASANVFTDRGITHSTEINVAATTTATGSTAPATALVVGMFYI